MFSKIWTRKSTPDCSQPERLKKALHEADAVIIGAGAGLSTSAGFTYAGERFRTYFSDFASKYGFTDMYSGGFYPYSTREEYWAYWKPVHLYQPLSERPEACIRHAVPAGTG